jgi:hypothetical protein
MASPVAVSSKVPEQSLSHLSFRAAFSVREREISKSSFTFGILRVPVRQQSLGAMNCGAAVEGGMRTPKAPSPPHPSPPSWTSLSGAV